MTLDKARELLANQVKVAGGYTRNGAKLVLSEVQKEYGQDTVDELIREFDLENLFGFKPGSKFRGF
jgi:hypothetical protein